ncbi:hypothetical protein ORJ00_02730 [Rheinheimera baltica]|uniref:hypothetical protein n=1 Tax=Rheinheimera baltica TaxID=67576 RepID=UPI00273D7FF8|nr:hypothetical protein [Rheinheimera baltica]MDP5141655.1 hypothetical protein [Rheinheimera baltica]MDP5151310.1 hypothetical protein [Rheinheimera baltica]
MKTLTNLAVAVCIGLSAYANASAVNNTFEPMNTSVKNTERHIALDLAVIKSTADIYKLDVAESPLSLLSSDTRNRFIDSLVFNERGLAGFSYIGLEAELTPSQIYKLLGYFGAQHLASVMTNARTETSTDILILNQQPPYQPLRGKEITPMGPPGDHKGYACSERATCRESAGAICMSSC